MEARLVKPSRSSSGRSGPIQLHGFGVISGHALSSGIERAKIVLRLRVTLAGGFAIPRRRLSVVLLDAEPVLIEICQVVLRRYVARFGGFAVVSSGGRIVPWCTGSVGRLHAGAVILLRFA
jgi:hypothetical protein